MRQFYLGISLALISLVASSLVGEGALRWLAPDLIEQDVTLTTTANQYAFYRYDPHLGWGNKPNTVGMFSRPEFSYQVAINSSGYRDKERTLTKRPGKRRGVVVGDSFVWGIGVANADRFTDILEREIPDHEFLNLGVSGYGPLHYYLMREEIVRFNPDLVIIAFCLGNDFVDNVEESRYGYFKPYAQLTDRLEILGVPPPRVPRFHPEIRTARLAQVSALYSAFSKATHTLRRTNGDLPPIPTALLTENSFYTQDEETSDGTATSVAKAVAVNEALMGQLATFLRERTIEVAVMSVPTKCEYYKGCDSYSAREEHHETRDLLRQTLSNIDVPLIDLLLTITPEDFWVSDGHWRPSGHRKAAEEIEHYLLNTKPSL